MKKITEPMRDNALKKFCDEELTRAIVELKQTPNAGETANEFEKIQVNFKTGRITPNEFAASMRLFFLSDRVKDVRCHPQTNSAIDTLNKLTDNVNIPTEKLTTKELHEILHRDVALANIYRTEFVKHAMSLAAAALVFTISFVKDIIPTGTTALYKPLLGAGWCCLLASLLAGLLHLSAWEKFYIAHRDHKNDAVQLKITLTKLKPERALIMNSQAILFLLGLFLISLFCFLNLR